MTDEEIRIAIAECCPEIMKGGYIESGMPMRHIRGDHFEPFDCVNDLNAIAEAKTWIIEPYQTLAFAQHIYAILRRDWTTDRWECFDTWGRNYAYSSATSRQQCEALLCTICKWKE